MAPESAPPLPIPRGDDGPIFPAPWAARAFALAVALNERDVFTWSEWSDALGAEIARNSEADAADPEAYWRAWLAALESLLTAKKVARSADLVVWREAWRDAAQRTPHGQPIEPPARPQA
jgi:nitrile hydratase accessory protein